MWFRRAEAVFICYIRSTNDINFFMILFRDVVLLMRNKTRNIVWASYIFMLGFCVCVCIDSVFVTRVQ